MRESSSVSRAHATLARTLVRLSIALLAVAAPAAGVQGLAGLQAAPTAQTHQLADVGWNGATR
jgi:hypothetical protein